MGQNQSSTLASPLPRLTDVVPTPQRKQESPLQAEFIDLSPLPDMFTPVLGPYVATTKSALQITRANFERHKDAAEVRASTLSEMTAKIQDFLQNITADEYAEFLESNDHRIFVIYAERKAQADIEELGIDNPLYYSINFGQHYTDITDAFDYLRQEFAKHQTYAQTLRQESAVLDIRERLITVVNEFANSVFRFKTCTEQANASMPKKLNAIAANTLLSSSASHLTELQKCVSKTKKTKHRSKAHPYKKVKTELHEIPYALTETLAVHRKPPVCVTHIMLHGKPPLTELFSTSETIAVDAFTLPPDMTLVLFQMVNRSRYYIPIQSQYRTLRPRKINPSKDGSFLDLLNSAHTEGLPLVILHSTSSNEKLSSELHDIIKDKHVDVNTVAQRVDDVVKKFVAESRRVTFESVHAHASDPETQGRLKYLATSGYVECKIILPGKTVINRQYQSDGTRTTATQEEKSFRLNACNFMYPGSAKSSKIRFKKPDRAIFLRDIVDFAYVEGVRYLICVDTSCQDYSEDDVIVADALEDLKLLGGGRKKI